MLILRSFNLPVACITKQFRYEEATLCSKNAPCGLHCALGNSRIHAKSHRQVCFVIRFTSFATDKIGWIRCACVFLYALPINRSKIMLALLTADRQVRVVAQMTFLVAGIRAPVGCIFLQNCEKSLNLLALERNVGSPSFKTVRSFYLGWWLAG